jgi:hypothetical protein
MVWFKVCLAMFETRALFDALLRPAIEGPRVTSSTNWIDETERPLWQESVSPKVAGCDGAETVLEPHFTSLDEAVSVITAETDASGNEALLSFYGEPFMVRASNQDVPRYIFHVQRNSELVSRLQEL